MRKGFTLMELIIVVVIIGILAMIGLPQYFKVAERGRAAEGFAALGALRGAQIRFASENPAGTTTGNLTDLDMSMPNLRYFGNLTPNAGTNVQTGGQVGSVQRTNGYTLNIAANGTITCTAGGNVGCPPMPQ